MSNSITMIAGIDAGNRFLKAVTTYQEVICPSTVGQGREDLLRMQNKNNEMILRYEGSAYFVGELADKESHDVSLALDETKTEHKHTIVLILAAVLMLAPADTRWITVKAVVGMPVSHYRDRETRQKLIDRLKGKVHEVEVGGKKRCVQFTHVLPFPEGAAELFTILPHYPEYADKDTLIGNIHVGAWRTSYVALEAMDYVDRLSGSLPLGMHQALRMVKTKRLLHEIERLSKNNHDLAVQLNDARRSIARQISDNLRQHWTNLEDFNAIYICGLGASILQSFIPQAKVFPRPARLADRMVIADAPHEQMATARGLYEVGVLEFGLSADGFSSGQ